MHVLWQTSQETAMSVCGCQSQNKRMKLPMRCRLGKNTPVISSCWQLAGALSGAGSLALCRSYRVTRPPPLPLPGGRGGGRPWRVLC